MSGQDHTRERIISSVFSKRNADGELEESYVAHLKIWDKDNSEKGSGGQKPRYILLAETLNGSALVHKSRRNTNGTFSIGKTWKLAELRGVEVLDSRTFSVIFARTYVWTTENEEDQQMFLNSLVRLHRSVLGDHVPLYLIGFSVEGNTQRYRSMSPKPQHQSSSNMQKTVVGSDDIQVSRSSTSPSFLKSLGGLPTLSPVPVPVPPSSLNHNERFDSSTNSIHTSIDALNELGDERLLSRDLGIATGILQSANGTQRQQFELIPVLAASRRKENNARISFFDPANQLLSELLLSRGGGSFNKVDIDEGYGRMSISNIEQMIEGYERISDDMLGRKTVNATVDQIEARLTNELIALEKANMHSILETDSRLDVVMDNLENAILKLDNVDSLLQSYRIHLTTVGDDISYIQSQKRGLQVQTQNQRSLLSELEKLLYTIHVDRTTLLVLTQESLVTSEGISALEDAAAILYKALLAARDNEMAAMIERLHEYRDHNIRFCKRLLDYFIIMFTAQCEQFLNDNDHFSKLGENGQFRLTPHKSLESFLGRYSGLMLFLKEMDESRYSRVCAAYYSIASELHGKQFKVYFRKYIALIKAPNLGDQTRNINRLQNDGLKNNKLFVASEVPKLVDVIFSEMKSQIHKEEIFLADFLQINDAAVTFADYMALEQYFRRQASQAFELSPNTTKLIHNAMDFIFGFLASDLEAFIDDICAKDETYVTGILSCLEIMSMNIDSAGTMFFQRLLGRQYERLKFFFEHQVDKRVDAIKRSKRNPKRDKVAQFVQNFSGYISRVEIQLEGEGSSDIRQRVNTAYEQIFGAMLDTLSQQEKGDGEGEEKVLLNRYIVLIVNMHYLVAQFKRQDFDAFQAHYKWSKSVYDENSSAYARLVLRRPFSKLINYFEGVQQVLKTSEASELVKNSGYNRSALKRVLKEYSNKDVRKNIDILYKRVEKHFMEADTNSKEGSKTPIQGNILFDVWTECEAECVKMTHQYASLIKQCYPDSNLSLDYTTQDIEDAFKRHLHT